MKAVILEIIKERAVVMKEDGTVRRVRNKNYSIGDEIYMKKGIFSHRKWAPIVAALLIFAMVGTGTWAYATPAYEISLVEEDGVEILIKVNKLDKVLDIIVRDEEGEEIPLDDELDSKDLEDVLYALMEKYDIESESKFVLMTTMSDDEEKSDAIAERIKENVLNVRAQEAHERNEERNEAKINNDDIDINDENIEVKGLSPEDVEEAKDLGITPGKYNIVKNLMGKDVEEYLVYLEDEYKLDLDDEEDYKELSKKIMEEFSASRGEKNGVKFQDEDRDDKVKKDKNKEDTTIEETTVLESRDVDPDDEDDDNDDIEEENEERQENPGNSNEAPGQSNSKNR